MRFSFTSRMMLWLHPCPLGGKGGCVRRNSTLVLLFLVFVLLPHFYAGAYYSRALFHLPLPLFRSVFLLFKSSYFPFLLKTLSRGRARNSTKSCMFKSAFLKLEICLLIPALGVCRSQFVFTLSTPSLTYQYVYSPNHCLE